MWDHYKFNLVYKFSIFAYFVMSILYRSRPTLLLYITIKLNKFQMPFVIREHICENSLAMLFRTL